ncbi:MAG: lipid A biosynthesis lauroyl acyltransferase [Alphaproteobacteria bacterium]|nr:lipid A biosynthesis lauroyl acyltransferase [Alphaproteobacteria bacterium]
MARNRRRNAALRRIGDTVLGFLAVRTLRIIRLFDVATTANLAGRLTRWVGPWLPEHRIGRANLAAAFPDKSPAEIETILLGVWDNLGRVGAEFAHIDRLWDHSREQGRGRVLDSSESERIARQLHNDGKPALIFAAHLANWELAAVGAHAYGIDSTVVYRRPNNRAISDEIINLRAGCMGTLIPTGLQAPFKLIEALHRGSHVAMLVDQYATQGVPVTFFGRRTRANAMIARLARHVDCPIHGARVVRYPGDRFQLQLTEAIDVPRDAEGQVDVERTMQVITDVVEGWVRDTPEQWLWLHRRWRDE